MKLKNLKLRLRLEKFAKEELWIHLIVLSTISLFAYLFNKPYEAIMFMVAHYFIRKEFKKQYHSGFTSVCIFITLSIGILGIYMCIPIEISLLSAIPVAYGISWVGYIAQDRLDAYIELKKYIDANIWNMTEEQLRKYCQLHGIFNERADFVVYIVIHHWRFADIANKLGYSIDTLKDWSEICKKKLKIREWKP